MPLDPLEKETHPLLGAEIDKYKIVEVLNAGGMGIVFKARQKVMDRDIALKLLPPELAKDEVNLQRLEREAKALAQLNHPNIIATYDFGLTDTAQGYLAMEYVEGLSLDELLEKVGILKPGRAVYIFKQIADGIRFAHQKGIVHRDLKPQNIMLTDIVSKDQVKILDFGIARIAQDSKRLTRVGEVVGSPIYMAPEQCMGEAADGRADVYAFGVLMFRALTGHFPHMGPNLHETFMSKCTKDPPYFKDVAPRLQLPLELENICRKCLQRKPDDRYQQMEQVRDDLERIMMPTSATNPGASGAYASQGQDGLGSEYDLMQNMSPELYQTGWVHFDQNSGSSFRPASDSNSFESMEQPKAAAAHSVQSAPPSAKEFQTPPPPPPRQPMPAALPQATARPVSSHPQERTIKAKNFAMTIVLASIAVVAILALVALAFIKTTSSAAKEKSNSIQEMEKVFQDKQLREKAEETKPESSGLNIKSIEQPIVPEKSTSDSSNKTEKSSANNSTIDSAEYQKTRFGHIGGAKPAKEEASEPAVESEGTVENIHQSEIPSSTDRGLTLSPSTVSERVKGKSPSAAIRESKTREDQPNNREPINKDPDAFDANR